MDSGGKHYSHGDATAYARKWALGRNPRYYDFEQLGGDCTNFASQCIYAGAGVMNYRPVTGWYYLNLNSRSASWSGVEFLYNFLIRNAGPGPYGREVSAGEVLPGDILQLGNEDGHFYHSPVIVETYPEILVCAHSYDCLDKPLSAYSFDWVRYIHIDGVKLS